jgi:membrane-associated phospholipid phosphatase
MDPTFQFFSNSATPCAIAAPVIVYSVGFFSKDKEIKNKAIVMTKSILVSTFSNFAIKYLVHRDRPFVTYPYIEKESDGGSPSFPSGHTEATFATATSLSLAFPKWYVIVPSYIWAGSVGYSRMHLGVHYPSDVLAGALVGTTSSYLTYRANKWLQGRKKNHISNPVFEK